MPPDHPGATEDPRVIIEGRRDDGDMSEVGAHHLTRKRPLEGLPERRTRARQPAADDDELQIEEIHCSGNAMGQCCCRAGQDLSSHEVSSGRRLGDHCSGRCRLSSHYETSPLRFSRDRLCRRIDLETSVVPTSAFRPPRIQLDVADLSCRSCRARIGLASKNQARPDPGTDRDAHQIGQTLARSELPLAVSDDADIVVHHHGLSSQTTVHQVPKRNIPPTKVRRYPDDSGITVRRTWHSDAKARDRVHLYPMFVGDFIQTLDDGLDNIAWGVTCRRGLLRSPDDCAILGYEPNPQVRPPKVYSRNQFTSDRHALASTDLK
jgi:hypothetical protein